MMQVSAENDDLAVPFSNSDFLCQIHVADANWPYLVLQRLSLTFFECFPFCAVQRCLMG
jgi:hypothetical protein